MSVDAPPDRIVCVHADPSNRQSIVDTVDSEAGVEVVGVESGSEALEELDSGVCCLVFGDDVGEMTPAALAEEGSASDPDRPLLFAPSSPDAAQLFDVLSAGATGVIEPGATANTQISDAVETYRRRRKQARESEMLDGLFSSLPVAMYVKDEAARIIRITDVPGGTDPDEARGKTDLELFGEDLARESYEDDMRVIEDGEEIHEKIERSAEGEVKHWSSTTKVPWEADGTTKGLFGITQNITEYKETERQLRHRIARLEQFTNYVAHDVRTPLEIASSHLELAREFVADSDLNAARTSLQQVGSALDQIEELIDDFQELTREESIGRLSRETSQIPLKETIWSVWEHIDTGMATLSVSAPDGTTIRASDSQLRPLLGNLVKNAVEHAGPDVSITVGLLNDGFYVEDDGPGIPESDREAVLEAGYTSESNGTGLGLSIVTDVVEAHDWSLEITEGDAGGARFEFQNCMVVADSEPLSPGASKITLSNNHDVGDVNIDGTATYDSTTDTWMVAGGGDDLWWTTNEFQFVYAAVDGDVRIDATIESIEDVHEYSKAGLMIRRGLEEDAAFGYIGRTPGHGLELLWRSTNEGLAVSQHPNAAEELTNRVRLERDGEQMTCWVLDDNDEWLALDQRQVDGDNRMFVGLAVCSVVPRRHCEATFSDVSVHPLE